MYTVSKNCRPGDLAIDFEKKDARMEFSIPANWYRKQSLSVQSGDGFNHFAITTFASALVLVHASRRSFHWRNLTGG